MKSNIPSVKTSTNPRKPYQKPVVETVQLRAKEHVMAVCRINSSATPGTTCQAPTPCFN